jgi:hypothetical protein
MFLQSEYSGLEYLLLTEYFGTGIFLLIEDLALEYPY